MASTVGAMRKRAHDDGYTEGYKAGRADAYTEAVEEAQADLSLVPPGTNLAQEIEVEMALRRLAEVEHNPIACRILSLLKD